MTRDEKIIFTENVSEEHSEMCSSDERYLQDEGDQKLEPYFSQYALVKNRVKVEVLWLKFLIENVNGSELLDMFSFDRLPDLVSIYTGFSLNSYARISELESNSDYNGDGVEAVVDQKLFAAADGIVDLVAVMDVHVHGFFFFI